MVGQSDKSDRFRAKNAWEDNSVVVKVWMRRNEEEEDVQRHLVKRTQW